MISKIKSAIIGVMLLSISSTAYAVDIEKLIEQCALPAYKKIIPLLIDQESSKRPYVLNINKGMRVAKQPQTKEELINLIKVIDKAKVYRFDIGIMQVNSSHFRGNGLFKRHGFKVTDAADPCTNIMFGSMIFDDAVRMAKGDIGKAMSIYNTGNIESGFKNGYVENVFNMKEVEKSK